MEQAAAKGGQPPKQNGNQCAHIAEVNFLYLEERESTNLEELLIDAWNFMALSEEADEEACEEWRNTTMREEQITMEAIKKQNTSRDKYKAFESELYKFLQSSEQKM